MRSSHLRDSSSCGLVALWVERWNPPQDATEKGLKKLLHRATERAQDPHDRRSSRTGLDRTGHTPRKPCSRTAEDTAAAEEPKSRPQKPRTRRLSCAAHGNPPPRRHPVRRLLAAPVPPRVPFAPADTDAATATAGMATPLRATAVLAWCAHSPSSSLARGAARGTPFHPATRWPLIALVLVSCRGSGEDGQLGMGGNEEKDWPHFVEALGPYAVTAVVAGSRNSLAICDDGRVRPLPGPLLVVRACSFRVELLS
jgi:hypothetical protein